VPRSDALLIRPLDGIHEISTPRSLLDVHLKRRWQSPDFEAAFFGVIVNATSHRHQHRTHRALTRPAMLNLIVAASSAFLLNQPHVQDISHSRVCRSAPLCMTSEWSSFDEVPTRTCARVTGKPSHVASSMLLMPVMRPDAGLASQRH
jgi:hypothetical protein